MPEIEQQFLSAYDTLADAIFRHCYFRVFSRERAQDLMQETFVRTWEFVAKGAEIRNIRAFLYRVANNLIVDESRKKKTVSLDELQDEGFQPVSPEKERMQNITDGRMVMKFLDKLEEKYHDVLVMRYVDDLMPKEIAEILGEAENTISVRLHRGLKQVRQLLNAQQHGEAL